MGSLGRAASCSSTVVRYAPPAVGDVSRALVAAGSGDVVPGRRRSAGVYRPVAAWYLATMPAGCDFEGQAAVTLHLAYEGDSRPHAAAGGPRPLDTRQGPAYLYK